MTEEHQRFLDLTLPHLDVVWSVSRRVARYPLEAEDLVQETYLRAFARFAQRRSDDVRPWLVAICVNAARSHGRQKRRRPTEVSEPDVVLAAPDDVAGEAVGAVERETLGRALAELPEEQRMAIVLVDVTGLTAAQAADIVGSPRGTILSRVHRGRRKLAQFLTEKDAIDGV